jgi:hypothetical protein
MKGAEEQEGLVNLKCHRDVLRHRSETFPLGLAMKKAVVDSEGSFSER